MSQWNFNSGGLRRGFCVLRDGFPGSVTPSLCRTSIKVHFRKQRKEQLWTSKFQVKPFRVFNCYFKSAVLSLSLSLSRRETLLYDSSKRSIVLRAAKSLSKWRVCSMNDAHSVFPSNTSFGHQRLSSIFSGSFALLSGLLFALNSDKL